MSTTTDQQLPDPARGLRGSWHALVLLGLFALGLVAARLQTRDEPLDRDLATYAVIGHELLAGRPLYIDLWDNKPPGIFITFAAAESVFGYGRTAILALGLIAALAAMFGIDRAGAAVGRAGGLWAAGFWVATCSDLKLQANQPNTEVFINALLAWFFALLLEIQAKGGVKRALAAGTLLALASAYKQVALLAALPALAALVIATPATERRRSLGLCAWMLAPAAVLGLGLATGYAAAGGLRIFWDTNVVYSRYYTGGILQNLARSVGPEMLPYLKGKWALAPLAILTAAFLALGRKGDLRGPWLLLAGWLIGTHVAVSAPGKFHPHYFQLWLPPLAIGSGWLVARVGRADRWIARVAGAWAVLMLLILAIPNYGLTAEQWSVRKFGDQFVRTERLGAKLHEVLRPGETLYQWGKEDGLFFATQARPTTGVTWFPPLTEGPLKDELTARTLGELQRSKPDLVVICRYAERPGEGHPIMDWIHTHYREVAPVDSRYARFRLLVLPASDLAHRLSTGFPPSPGMPQNGGKSGLVLTP